MRQSWFTPSSLLGLLRFTPSSLLDWLRNPFSFLLEPLSFDLGALALGYLTVVLSWVGYHQSIIDKPIVLSERPGFLRFIVDVILLGLYWLLLVEFQSFVLQLLVLVYVYFFFVIWDTLKWREHKLVETPDSRRRRGVTTLWFAIFAVLFTVYNSFRPAPTIGHDWLDWSFLITSLLCTVLYRKHKSHLRPARLLDVLAFHRAADKHLVSKPLLIYVAGPYTADDPGQVEKNVNRAIDAGIEIFRRGHFPFIPHLTDFVDKRAKESGAPLTWNDFIAWDKPWISKADALLFLGSSPGAELELREADRLGKRIFRAIEEIPVLSSMSWASR